MHIDSYKFGRMIIDGAAYTDDLIILPDRLLTGWWRNKGHIFALDDCRELLKAQPSFIVFGIGAYSLVKLSPDLIEELNRRKIEYQALPTKAACERFNQAANPGTAGAFHLTC